MLIDHLIYAAPDLTAAVADLEDRFGVRAQAGGSHTGLGTHNALLALGPRTYLEIIAPDPGQPAPPGPRPFGLDDLARGALVGWALTCDDIDQAVAEARSLGYDPGQIVDGQRVAPAGTVLRWRATVNGDRPTTWSPSSSAGAHRASGQVSTSRSQPWTSLRIEHPDPASLTPGAHGPGRRHRGQPRRRPRRSWPRSAARPVPASCGDAACVTASRSARGPRGSARGRP